MAKTVLVVDDSPTTRRVIAAALSATGWEVVGEAVDGREAVDLYRRLLPDAVTMDLVMHGADGLRAIEEIIDGDPWARIVVVSAVHGTGLISEAIRKGAQDFVAKPFSAEQLQETMRIVAEAACEPVIV